MAAIRTCRFWQSNLDRTQIFAMVAGGDADPAAFGPLRLDQIRTDRFLSPLPWDPSGNPTNAAGLVRHADEFHDLQDFYRFYGYPAEVIAWVEETKLNVRSPTGFVLPGGRDIREVAQRLGLDATALRDAAWADAVMTGQNDPEGYQLFYRGFDDNWAVGDPSGRLDINPDSYRFKAWLSFQTSDHG